MSDDSPPPKFRKPLQTRPSSPKVELGSPKCAAPKLKKPKLVSTSPLSPELSRKPNRRREMNSCRLLDLQAKEDDGGAEGAEGAEGAAAPGSCSSNSDDDRSEGDDSIVTDVMCNRPPLLN